MNNDNLKLIYSSIIRGASSFLLDKNLYYIKHLSALDSSDIDIKKQEYFELARSRGYITYSEKYNELISKNLWTVEKENLLKEYKDFLGNLHHSKKLATLQKDKKLYDVDINNYQGKILELEIEKGKLIGKTAESFADRRANEYYIFVSLYKDDKLSRRFYDMEQFRDLDQEELDKLVKIYNEKMGDFNEGNLKKISLLPGFFNLFCLTGDNIYQLFGKPFIELTYYQIELISWAKQFKNILQNAKNPPPNHLFNEPDKLLSWFGMNENLQESVADIPDDPSKKVIMAGKSMVGASSEDLAAAGISTASNDKLTNALKNSPNGELGFAELLKLNI